MTLCHGETDERIKGPGTMDASPGEFPYMVTTVMRDSDEFVGSGVLLRRQVVLANGKDYVNLK